MMQYSSIKIIAASLWLAVFYQPIATFAGTASSTANKGVAANARPSNKPVSTIKAAPEKLPAVAPVVSPATKEEAPMLSAAVDANNVRVLLAPERETTLSSTIAGRIVSLNGSLGKSFKAGEILVTFDCEEANARVEMSKAELSGAIEQHEAKVRMQGLDQASDVEVAVAASAANKAKAQLGLHKTQVSQCNVYAPWAGRIAKLNVRAYMTVTPGQPMLELVKEGPLKLRMNVPSKLLARVKVGSKFNVMIDETAQTYPAAVTAINSRVDPVSQTVEIEARLTKGYRELLSGMSGVADINSFY